MSSLTKPLRDHHAHCDALLGDAEEAAHDGDWARCGESLRRFASELEAHLATEEQALFPAFEAATGITTGPTRVMRIEHAQFRELIRQLDTALASKNASAFLGGVETLMVLMQQHNMKEENMLYPMCDRSLEGAGLDVGQDLKQRLA